MKRVFKQGLSLLLTLVLVFGSVAVGGEEFGQLLNLFTIHASAATQLNVTQQDAVNWALKNYVDSSVGDYDGHYKGECLSLIKRYTYYGLGLKTKYTVASGSAYGLKDTAFIQNNFDIIYSGAPQPGDIFVYYAWAKYGGITMAYGYGHCGIVVGVSSNAYSFVDWNSDGNGAVRYVEVPFRSTDAIDRDTLDVVETVGGQAGKTYGIEGRETSDFELNDELGDEVRKIESFIVSRVRERVYRVIVVLPRV